MNINHESLTKLEALFGESTGGLYAWSEKTEIIDSPILIVGLGGMGLSAVRSIKHEIDSRLIRNNQKLPNLAYLAFDTEADQKTKAYRGTTLSAGELVILPSSNTSNIYQSARQGTHTHIGEWIRDDLDPNAINDEGAGGVRQFGRMLLFDKINEIKNKLKEKIDSLRKATNPSATYSNNDDILVFICAGISGGTGSGSFIDMPYIIRYVAGNLTNVRSKVTNIGLLFLPDVNDAAAHAPRNGYAALKELNYLSNLGENGNKGCFKQDYGAFKVVDELPPYMHTLLISASQSDGTRLSANHSINMAAETVINFIASEDAQKDTNGKLRFSVLAYLNNISTLRNTFLRHMSARDKRPMLFRYLGSGTAMAKLDLDGVLIYLTHVMFDKMSDIYNRSPLDKKSEFDEFIKTTGLTFEKILGKFKKEKVLDANKAKYVKDDYKEIEQGFDMEYESYSYRLSERYMEIKNELLSILRESLDSAFKDRKRGPYYVSRLIYNGESAESLVRLLDSYISGKLKSKDAPDEESVNTCMTALDTERNKMIKGLVGGLYRPTRGYISALENYVNERHEFLAYKYADRLIRDVKSYLNDVGNGIFNVYTELISVMARIFKQNADILSKTGRTVTTNETGFYWNIVSLPELINGFSSIIGDEYLDVSKLDINADMNDNISFRTVSENFLNNLLEDSEKWLNIHNPSVIAAQLNSFINEQFAKICRKSIDMYLKLAVRDDSKVQEAIDTMFTRLKDDSKVMFPYTRGMPSYSFYDTAYVSVPQGLGTLKGVAASVFPGNDSQIKESGMYDRIFVLRNTSPLPAALYQYLSAYETKDYNNVSESEGYHLYFGGIDGKGVNWKTFLPSPNIGALWAENGNMNERYLRQIDDINRGVFFKAVQMGYIVSMGDEVECYYGECVDVHELLKGSGIDGEEAIASASIADARAASEVIESELANPLRKQTKAKLFDRMLTEPDKTPNMDYASYIFLQMPDVITEIKRMVENHEKLSEIKEKLAAVTRASETYELALKALITGVIYKDKENPSQYDYIDEWGVEQVLTVITTDQFREQEYYLFDTFRRSDIMAALTEEINNKYLNMMKADRSLLKGELMKMKIRFSGSLPSERDPNCVIFKLKNAKGIQRQMEKLAFYREIAEIANTLAQMLGEENEVPVTSPPAIKMEIKAPNSSSWVCSCSAENMPNAKFCQECGEKRKNTTEAKGWICICGTMNTGNGKFCHECGSKRNEEIFKCPGCGWVYMNAKPRFCQECGTKL